MKKIHTTTKNTLIKELDAVWKKLELGFLVYRSWIDNQYVKYQYVFYDGVSMYIFRLTFLSGTSRKEIEEGELVRKTIFSTYKNNNTQLSYLSFTGFILCSNHKFTISEKPCDAVLSIRDGIERKVNLFVNDGWKIDSSNIHKVHKTFENTSDREYGNYLEVDIDLGHEPYFLTLHKSELNKKEVGILNGVYELLDKK